MLRRERLENFMNIVGIGQIIDGLSWLILKNPELFIDVFLAPSSPILHFLPVVSFELVLELYLGHLVFLELSVSSKLLVFDLLFQNLPLDSLDVLLLDLQICIVAESIIELVLLGSSWQDIWLNYWTSVVVCQHGRRCHAGLVLNS